MRTIGAATRALELMCRRAVTRFTFGETLSQRANVQDWIAEARIDIETVRLLTMKAAWLMDTVGNRHARVEVAAIKVAAPNLAPRTIDRAIPVHGGAGVSDDFPLASMWAHLRTLRVADGPDEVHKRTVAQYELGPYTQTESSNGRPLSTCIGDLLRRGHRHRRRSPVLLCETGRLGRGAAQRLVTRHGGAPRFCCAKPAVSGGAPHKGWSPGTAAATP